MSQQPIPSDELSRLGFLTGSFRGLMRLHLGEGRWHEAEVKLAVELHPLERWMHTRYLSDAGSGHVECLHGLLSFDTDTGEYVSYNFSIQSCQPLVMRGTVEGQCLRLVSDVWQTREGMVRLKVYNRALDENTLEIVSYLWEPDGWVTQSSSLMVRVPEEGTEPEFAAEHGL